MVQEKQLKELFKYIEANWDVCVSQVDKTDIKRIFGGVLCDDIMNDTLHEVKAEPELNQIEQAYERGEKIRYKKWSKNEWIKKHSKTDVINEIGNILENTFRFNIYPNVWELYTETEQVADQVTDQEKPALNSIAEAYERGEKVRHKDWIEGDYILKYDEIKCISENRLIQSFKLFSQKINTNPEKWELYKEPAKQPAPPMTYEEAVNLIISRKLTHKLARNDSWFAYKFYGYNIHFCDESGKDMIWVRFDELDLNEWYPYKKPFDKDRFEAMFRAVVESGENTDIDYSIKVAENALKQLDAYYATKEGGNNE